MKEEKIKDTAIENIQNLAEIVAYVDGSYNDKTNEFSYGAVVFYKGEEYHFKEKYHDIEMAKMRNVAGEIFGAMKAMSIAEKKCAKTLAIFHDYQGISAWPKRDWKANLDGTRNYVSYYDQVVRKGTKIIFYKVKGHTGMKYNELADKLAREALGI